MYVGWMEDNVKTMQLVNRICLLSEEGFSQHDILMAVLMMSVLGSKISGFSKEELLENMRALWESSLDG
jgi:hydrogenase-4 membrane subunit HyfE